MFNNKNKVKRPGASFNHSSVTILTPGCHFSGKLYCRGSSRIGGKVDGEIVSEGLLIIEEEAMINCHIIADEAIIQGHVKGRLESTKKVELASACVFEGEIVTPVLIIHEGATFNGTSSMKAVAVEKIPAIEKLHKKISDKEILSEKKEIRAH